MTGPAEPAADTNTEAPGGGLAAQAAPVTPEGAQAGAEQPAKQTAEQAETAEQTETAGQAETQTETTAKPKRGRPKGGGAKKTRNVELVLTISGGADGEWQADLRHGTERLVQGMQIPATAVSRAAKELNPEISGAIETVLDESRKQHRERLEQLEAELSKVKQALADLDDEST